jgi:hypothetical protein
MLRERHEQPRGCHAAKRDKFSPSNVDCHVTLQLGVNASGMANNTTL